MLTFILHKVNEKDRVLGELRGNVEIINQMIVSHSKSIQLLDTLMDHVSSHLNPTRQGGFSSDTMANPKNEV